jgi:hypothetical protein
MGCAAADFWRSIRGAAARRQRDVLPGAGPDPCRWRRYSLQSRTRAPLRAQFRFVRCRASRWTVRGGPRRAGGSLNRFLPAGVAVAFWLPGSTRSSCACFGQRFLCPGDRRRPLSASWRTRWRLSCATFGFPAGVSSFSSKIRLALASDVRPDAGPGSGTTTITAPRSGCIAGAWPRGRLRVHGR